MKLGSILLLMVMLFACDYERSQKVEVVADLPTFETSAEEINTSTANAISKADLALDQIAKLPRASMTFENTVRALDDIFYEIDYVASRIYLMANTSMDKAVRDSANDAGLKFENWLVDAASRKDIYEVIQAYADSKPQLIGEDKRLLEETLRDFKRQGFHLAQSVQEEIKTLKKELADLTNQISKNVNGAAEKILLTPEEVSDIPADALSVLKKDEEGRYIVNLGVAYETSAIMRNSPREEIRKKVFKARQSRAKESNKSVMEVVIQKRARLAGLLGYKSWADYQIEPKMAQTGENALKFVEGLTGGLEPKFRQELTALAAIKISETNNPDAKIESWDTEYFIAQYEKSQFSLDLDSMKKYFRYETVLDGMFKIFEKIFGLKIEKVEAPYIWAPDVELIQISDVETGTIKGFLYLDMFPRPEHEKYGHFASFGIRSGKLLSDGKYRRPIGALVCNFPRPTEGKPALLSFDNVETLFHEFGHALHNILTMAKYSRFAGTSVPRDFVELPSQLLENWVHDKRVLDTFAYNYENPSDTISQEVLNKIDASSLATIGTYYRRQLSFGTMDLRLHSLSGENATIDIVEFTNNVLAEVFLAYPDGSSFITGFTHLFGGYDAGYYGYAWADNLSADAASVFKLSPNGFLDEELGMKLRKEIYEMGSSRDVNTSLEKFLGRPTNNEAFLKKLGIGK